MGRHVVDVHTVRSAALSTDRKVSIALPQSPPEKVVLMADGQTLEVFLGSLSSATWEHLPPVAFVAPHAGNRLPEYNPGEDPAAFRSHLNYFCDEVPSWAASELGLGNARFTGVGYSAGASVLMGAALTRPELFDGVVAFGVATAPEYIADVVGLSLDPSDWWPDIHSAPRFYLSTGTEDATFISLPWAVALTASGADMRYVEPSVGHDFDAWTLQLGVALEWMYCDPASRPSQHPQAVIDLVPVAEAAVVLSCSQESLLAILRKRVVAPYFTGLPAPTPHVRREDVPALAAALEIPPPLRGDCG